MPFRQNKAEATSPGTDFWQNKADRPLPALAGDRRQVKKSRNLNTMADVRPPAAYPFTSHAKARITQSLPPYW